MDDEPKKEDIDKALEYQELKRLLADELARNDETVDGD